MTIGTYGVRGWLRHGCLAILGLTLVVGWSVAVQAGPIGPEEGLLHIAPSDARAMIDHECIVCGQVVELRRAGPVQLLTFADTPPGEFELVMYNDYASKFPGTLEDLYVGKNVCVHGFVSTYGTKPQVRLTSPAQVKVVDRIPSLQRPPTPKAWTGKREMKLATYNIRNLFDDVNDPYRNDDGTPAKPREELDRIAQVFKKLDADIVALQEVESRGYLQRFVDVFLADMGYTHVVHLEGNDVRGIDVALLSRIPVGPVTSYRHLTFNDEKGRTQSFNRDLLCVRLEPQGYRPFEVWVVHLKSNYGGRRAAEPVRLGEARQIRRILDERLAREPDAAIVICGDFNDTKDSDAVKVIQGSGATAMHELYGEIPESDQITYNKEPYRSMIDFILVSPAMKKRFVTGSNGILPGTVESSGSDHNPVSARFRME